MSTKSKTETSLKVTIGDLVFRPERVSARQFSLLNEIPYTSDVPVYYRKQKGKYVFYPKIKSAKSIELNIIKTIKIKNGR